MYIYTESMITITDLESHHNISIYINLVLIQLCISQYIANIITSTRTGQLVLSHKPHGVNIDTK